MTETDWITLAGVVMTGLVGIPVWQDRQNRKNPKPVCRLSIGRGPDGKPGVNIEIDPNGCNTFSVTSIVIKKPSGVLLGLPQSFVGAGPYGGISSPPASDFSRDVPGDWPIGTHTISRIFLYISSSETLRSDSILEIKLSTLPRNRCMVLTTPISESVRTQLDNGYKSSINS